MTTKNIPKNLLKEISKSLADFIISEERTVQNSESRFMQLGRDMQILYEETTAVTQQMQDAVGVIGGSEENSMLHGLGESVTTSIASLETSQNMVKNNLNQVDTVRKKLDDFHAMCPALERIAQFLRVIGLNICIECSESRRASELFLINAQEIKAFAENVIEVSGKIRDDSHNARVHLVAIHKKIASGLTQMQALSASASQVVQKAFEGIEQLMTLSFTVMEQASARSSAISSQVGEIVMGIQFHDNMSQRIGHINEALQEAASSCVSENEGHELSDQTETVTVVHAILNLQAKQIKEVIAGIEEIYRQNRHAFEEISNEVAMLASDLDPLISPNDHGKHPAREGEDNHFIVLQSALLQLGQILNQDDYQVAQIQEAEGEATETAARLDNHISRIRFISHETHLKSLNSIVKANRLGKEGKTIDVLAEAIKDLSRQTDTFVMEIENIHGMIVSGVNKLQGQSSKDSSGGCCNSTSLEEKATEANKTYDHFAKEALTASQRAEKLEKEIVLTASGLDFLEALAEEFTGNLRQLELLIEQLTPWVGELSEEALAKAVQISERYTMAEERLVHQQLFAENHDSDPGEIDLFEDDSCPVTAMNDSDTEDELGDNVELF